ncbi:MAG TPA: MauE/DoxX family redox-associated membrane protein [Trebonia sp.]|jgi:hypothetical protein|nr:MauE/DoxX family redox-associated membrane protein [Trebonia sp.]
MTEVAVAVLSAACCVYLMSAGAKLRGRSAYRSFAAGLAETGLVGRRLLPAVAAALAGCEAVVAVSLAAATALTSVGATGAAAVTVSALGLAIALTGVLAAGVAVILSRGTRARCACFGSASERALGRPQLARNLGLLALLVVALACAVPGHGRPAAGAATVAVVAGAVGGMLLIRFDDLIALFAPISSESSR